MAAGFKMALVADVRDFLKGTADVEKALERVSDSLDDVAKEAQRSGDKAAGAIDDAGRSMAKDTATATDKMERSFRDVRDAASTHAKGLGDDVDREVKRGTSKAGEATSEFKNEAAQNFAETASSFDGSMTSIADMVQSTFGGLGAMGGPIGLAAGAIGLLGGAAFTRWQQDAEKTKQVVSAMFDDMIASGQRYASESFIQTGVKDIIGDDKKFKQAQSLAKETGLTVGQALRAMAGDTDAARAAQDALTAAQNKASDEQAKIAEAYRTSGQRNVEASQANSEHISTLEGLQAALAGTTDAQAKATAQADAYQQAVRPTAQTAQDAAQAQSDLAAAIETATTAAATSGDVFDDTKGTLDLTTQAGRDAQDALLGIAKAAGDNATAMLANGASTDAVTAATSAAAGQFVNAATQMGYSKDQAWAYAQQLGLIPRDVSTTIHADTSAAYRDLLTLQAQIRDMTGDRTFRIAMGAGGQGGQTRAVGGSVAMGQSYIVGETQPELFVPGQSGTILNQQQILAALGRTTANPSVGAAPSIDYDRLAAAVAGAIGSITLTIDGEPIRVIATNQATRALETAARRIRAGGR